MDNKKWPVTRNFPHLGTVQWARPVSKPPFPVPSRRLRGALARGVTFEKKLSKRLALQYGGNWAASQWFQYQCQAYEYPRYCQMDGLLMEGSRLIVCEVKLRHTVDAYFQLHNLYLPVARAAFPGMEIALCEVVKWYDSSTAFPCSVSLLEDLHAARPGDFNVHIRSER